MKKVFMYGFLAALFFSITFVINKWLNVDKGGHWYWTASLRYFFVLILLSFLIFLKYGIKHYIDTLKCFIDNFLFWVFAGGIGFGVFYLSLCYASSYSEGWVLATTWQSTILFTPLVIYLLGNKVKLYGIVYLAIMFLGVCLVNSYAFQKSDTNIFHSILPILLSAICYPLGNTLCKYACAGKYKRLTINKFEISQNVFSQILMMVLGAMPVLIIAWFIFKPYNPTNTQIEFVFIVAVLTGVIATSLLYKARQLAGTDSNALAFADGTQALEAPLALFWEYTIFGGKLPSYIGILGLTLLCLGIFMFYKTNLMRKGV